MWILGPHSNSTESESQELGWESTSQVVLVHINVVKLLIFAVYFPDLAKSYSSYLLEPWPSKDKISLPGLGLHFTM